MTKSQSLPLLITEELAQLGAYEGIDASSAAENVVLGSNTYWSYVRSFPYSSERQHELDESNIQKIADVVFNATIVIRNNVLLENEALDNDTSIDGAMAEYFDKLFNTAASVVEAWYAIAQDVYDGRMPKPSEMPVIENMMPSRMPSHVTIFGTIVDEQGRNTSLTLTERSNILAAYTGSGTALGFYSWMNTMISSNGIDLDRHNNRRYRWMQDLRNNRAVAKEPGFRHTITPNRTKKAEAIEVNTVAEMRNVPIDTYFMLPITEIELKRVEGKDPQLKLYGVNLDAEGKTVVAKDYTDALYIYAGREDYEEILAWMLEAFNVDLINDNPVYVFEQPVRVMSIKRQGSKYVFYPEIKVVRKNKGNK